MRIRGHWILKDLGHYNKCMDPACKSRAQSWETAKREAADPIKKIIDKRKCCTPAVK